VTAIVSLPVTAGDACEKLMVFGADEDGWWIAATAGPEVLAAVNDGDPAPTMKLPSASCASA